MKICIVGGDGYIGFPLACKLAANGNDVLILDNLHKRNMASQFGCYPLFCVDMFETRLAKLFELTGMDTSLSYDFVDASILKDLRPIIMDFEPQVVINCTMPTSLALSTLYPNKALDTLQIIQNIVQSIDSECHFINLSPPMMATDLSIKDVLVMAVRRILRMYCDRRKLRVTNISLGSVYGIMGEYWNEAGLQTHIYYDDIFATVINRLVCQTMGGQLMTLYHNTPNSVSYQPSHDRTVTICRLDDAITGIDQAIDVCAGEGELRQLSLFSEALSLLVISNMVGDAASIEGHVSGMQYCYHHNPVDRTLGVSWETGFAGKPLLLTVGYIREMMIEIAPHAKNIDSRACVSGRYVY